LDEVVAHEVKLAAKQAREAEKKLRTFAIYEAPDGFRGSYAEVVAHEKALLLKGPPVAPHLDRVLFRVYEAEVGQRSSRCSEACFQGRLSCALALQTPCLCGLFRRLLSRDADLQRYVAARLCIRFAAAHVALICPPSLPWLFLIFFFN
jgi:hypothetical protein